jgi:hypothetical protein
MSTATNVLDLDAARRESAHPEGIVVRLGGEDFTLPAELPADVFDPFLTPEFDLSGLIIAVFKDKNDDGSESDLAERLVSLLFDRPSLPTEVIDAVYRALELLFGDEQWATFKAQRPSFKDLGRLVGGLFRLYGTSLGEAFASVSSVTTAGPTSKQTSPLGIPASTPDGSGEVAPAAATSSSASAA